MRLESYNYRGYYIRHQAFEGLLSSYVEPEVDSVFKIVPGLADPNCVSFESKNYPGYYLKHENFQIYLREYDGSDGFSEDATFRIVPGIADENLMSFQSYNYPNRYIRHRSYYLWIEEINTDLEKKDSTYIGIKVQ
ncbi:MAG: Alpha-L-arabinofuranosidase B (ABFB) [Firmicutes bacterium ADurb.Bin419]|nr:MAG: Alpha-L-arabinofuranosidase B (ABFB) [Firmicutes bacterium ADurb.Bin419]